jgi:hypothetical protein
MATMTLNRIGVLSSARITGILYAAIGLLIGIFFALFSLIAGAAAGAQGEGGAIPAILFGFGGLILWPLFYGVIGFVSAALGAFLYNLLAGFVGGVEMEFSE